VATNLGPSPFNDENTSSLKAISPSRNWRCSAYDKPDVGPSNSSFSAGALGIISSHEINSTKETNLRNSFILEIM
jgi:hypothetical protein